MNDWFAGRFVSYVRDYVRELVYNEEGKEEWGMGKGVF